MVTDAARGIEIPGRVQIKPGKEGLPRLEITSAAAEAHVYLHGAHVSHFQPRSAHRPVLWISDKSYFTQGKPIRGGVPVIFPWFGPSKSNQSLPAHGFGRTQEWTPIKSSLDGDDVSVQLALRSNDQTRKLWPHDFELIMTVTVHEKLTMALEVRNVSGEAFTFEEALHTYFCISDIRKITIDGLADRTYIDTIDAHTRKLQEGLIAFGGEVDRMYIDSADTIALNDIGFRRSIIISKSNSLATVVWNPWIEKAKRMPDFGDDEWPATVCIETANAGPHAITLQRGESHMMTATIGVE